MVRGIAQNDVTVVIWVLERTARIRIVFGDAASTVPSAAIAARPANDSLSAPAPTSSVESEDLRGSESNREQDSQKHGTVSQINSPPPWKGRSQAQ